jgi:hypothetical protein
MALGQAGNPGEVLFREWSGADFPKQLKKN